MEKDTRAAGIRLHHSKKEEIYGQEFGVFIFGNAEEFAEIATREQGGGCGWSFFHSERSGPDIWSVQSGPDHDVL